MLIQKMNSKGFTLGMRILDWVLAFVALGVAIWYYCTEGFSAETVMFSFFFIISLTVAIISPVNRVNRMISKKVAGK